MNGGGCFALLRCSTTIFPPFIFLPPLFFRTLLFNVLHVYSNRRSTKGGSFHLTQLGFIFFVFLLRFSCFFPVCLVHFFVLFPSSEATRTRASRNANSTRHLLLFLSREKKKRDERRIKKEKNQTTYGPFFVSSPLSFLYIFF